METSSLAVAIVSTILGAIGGLVAASIKIGKYQQKVDDACTRVTTIEGEIKKLNTDVTVCSTKIDERTRSAAATYTQRKSPISLNENGQSFLQKSGGDKFILENATDLVEKVKATNPKTAYDVQESSRKVLKDISNEDRFKPLKDFIFKEGLDLEILFLVLGIYLRDIAIPLLGFNMQDIDATDPRAPQSSQTVTK